MAHVFPLAQIIELVMCERRIMMNEAVHRAQPLSLESHRICECNHFDTNDTGDTIDGALWRHSSIALKLMATSLPSLLGRLCVEETVALQVRRRRAPKSDFLMGGFPSTRPFGLLFHPPVRPSQFLLLSFSSLSSLLSRSFWNRQVHRADNDGCCCTTYDSVARHRFAAANKQEVVQYT